MASGEWRRRSGTDAIYRVCTEVSGEWFFEIQRYSATSDPWAQGAPQPLPSYKPGLFTVIITVANPGFFDRVKIKLYNPFLIYRRIYRG